MAPDVINKRNKWFAWIAGISAAILLLEKIASKTIESVTFYNDTKNTIKGLPELNEKVDKNQEATVLFQGELTKAVTGISGDVKILSREFHDFKEINAHSIRVNNSKEIEFRNKAIEAIQER